MGQKRQPEVDREASEEFVLRSIRAGDSVAGLSLGDETFTPLKTFVRKHAVLYETHSLARTYGAFSSRFESKLLGYITIVCGEVEVKGNVSILSEPIDYLYKSYPAIKIARLAVDKRQRGKGLGKSLVNLALGIATDIICPAVGCRFAVVDSKQEAVDFYQKCGFTLLDTDENKTRETPVLFIDLRKAAQGALAATEAEIRVLDSEPPSEDLVAASLPIASPHPADGMP